jgi:TRAP-type mannitol/chloroaromatic compound transport system permease small subunit
LRATPDCQFRHDTSVTTAKTNLPDRAGKRTVIVSLKFSRAIDRLNEQFGVVATWFVLLSCLVSAGNAAMRYGINALLALGQDFSFLSGITSGIGWYGNHANAFLEAQWYMFAAIVLLGGPYTLKVNEHVRVDLFYGIVSERARIWIDIIGGLLFLLPICLILVYFTWGWFWDSFQIGEQSNNAGGLVRWPVKLLLPVGFALMALQGISEIIKRVAALERVIDADFKYEKPLQ